jgi:DNA-damage-inducible protein J
MNKTAVVHARVEPDTKKEAERLLKELGMSPTEAIRLFYRQICLRGGIPFPVLIPNDLTKKTLDDSARGEGLQSFDTLDEMFEKWDE